MKIIKKPNGKYKLIGYDLDWELEREERFIKEASIKYGVKENIMRSIVERGAYESFVILVNKLLKGRLK